jgi:hypothetical protein
MDKFAFYDWFMAVYHGANVGLAFLLTWHFSRGGQVTRRDNRRTLFLCSLLFVESVNFVWLVHFCDDLFAIRDQGLELGIWHLCIFGPIFLGTAMMCFFVTERRLLCAALCLSYLMLGGLVALVD